VPMEYARGTVRFSTGKATTIEDIDRAVEIVDSTVRRLKSQ
jgi:cysteine desulfurase